MSSPTLAIRALKSALPEYGPGEGVRIFGKDREAGAKLLRRAIAHNVREASDAKRPP